MNNVEAQLTYSPSGVLEINTEFYEDESIIEKQNDELGFLEEKWHADIEADRKINIKLEVEKYFSNCIENSKHRADALRLLTSLNRLIPHRAKDPLDRVLGFNFISSVGSVAIVYPHFQNWLNKVGLEEETSKQSLLAMALPFSKEDTQKTLKDFRFSRFIVSSDASARGWVFEVKSHLSKFKLSRAGESGDDYVTEKAVTQWYWLDLQTLGSCACWGVHGEDRDHLRLYDDSVGLYEMKPHNVDMAPQALSHILGIGVLAYEAAQYESNNDLLASIKWEEVSRHPLESMRFKK